VIGSIEHAWLGTNQRKDACYPSAPESKTLQSEGLKLAIAVPDIQAHEFVQEGT
jgi:hypothetical protein